MVDNAPGRKPLLGRRLAQHVFFAHMSFSLERVVLLAPLKAYGCKKPHRRQNYIGCAGAMEGCVCEELAEEEFVFQMGVVGTVVAQGAARVR